MKNYIQKSNMRKTFALMLQLILLSFTTVMAQSCLPKFDYYKSAKNIVFVNQSTTPLGIGNYIWDFGDGTPLTINNEHQLNHVYAQTGKYKVCLIDSFCPTNTMFCDSIKVENSKEVEARFTHQDFGNGTFIFNNSSVASNYPIITYQWDFGDGNISNDKVVKHNYHSSGQYVVSLTVLDSGNNFDIFYDTVNTTVTVPCYADFNFQYVNNQFEFQNLSSSPDSLVGYQWYFGDASNVNTQVNPTHGYNAIGNYTVTLVMKSATCSDTIQKTISQPDTALCNIKFTSLVNYQKVLFNVTSNNQEPLFEKYLIDYGDLTQDYMQTNSISHIYTDTGSYKVCVYSQINLCGIQLMNCDTVRIDSLTAICKANFELYDYEYSAKLYNSSIAYGSSLPSNVNINWGDGSIYSGIDSGFFIHTYANEGSYNVTLLMSNVAGCSDSLTKIVSVGPNYILRGKITQSGLPAFYSGVNVYSYDSISGLLYKNNYTSTDENGNYEIRLKKGYYLVQADFAFDPFNNGFYLPTYYKNKLNWDMADVIYVQSNRSGIDINLIPFNYDSTGIGNISGAARYGTGVVDQNGPIKEGKPAEKMLIYLIDGNGKTVAYTHTNADGIFDFGRVPAGNYKVWGEMAGKQTQPVLTSINGSVNNVSGIKIIIGKNSLTSSIGEQANTVEPIEASIYPNPSKGMLNIESATKNISSVQVYDITGQLILESTLENDKSKVSLDISNYKNGLYIIKINSVEGNNNIKKVLKQD
ncbi:MAG: PKD domain-containing protein [Bacteroidetes bacterium]|nr:PKD domain-containing protein [Bacteroidota bacterium]